MSTAQQPKVLNSDAMPIVEAEPRVERMLRPIPKEGDNDLYTQS